MIRSIEIQRLRGIAEGKLEDLHDLTVLVGCSPSETHNGCNTRAVLHHLYGGWLPSRRET